MLIFLLKNSEILFIADLIIMETHYLD